MDPVTKEDLLNELRAEWRNGIKSSVAAEFASWKPAIDSQIADLQEAVDLLQKQHVEGKTNDAGEASATDHPDLLAQKNILSSEGSLARNSPWADGHDTSSSPRTAVDGLLDSPPAPPANGTVDLRVQLPAVAPTVPLTGGSGNFAPFLLPMLPVHHLCRFLCSMVRIHCCGRIFVSNILPYMGFQSPFGSKWLP